MTAKGDSKPYGIIYCIEHCDSGRCYIGQTVQTLEARWASHCRADTTSRLHRSIKRYGKSAFSAFVLDEANSKEHLDALEDFYINLFQSITRGYNLRGGGSWGKHSPESKELMSRKVRIALERPEYRIALSKAQKLRVHTAEHNAKISVALTGKEPTAQTRAKLSDARAKLWCAPQTRENMRLASVKARQAAEHVSRVAEKTKAQWENPEQRAKLKAAQAAGKAAFWADPEKKAARIAKRRATIAAKKAAQI